MTLVACTIMESGIFIPSAFAVFMLMINSNLVGCSIGKSPGFAPLRILSTSKPHGENVAESLSIRHETVLSAAQNWRDLFTSSAYSTLEGCGN